MTITQSTDICANCKHFLPSQPGYYQGDGVCRARPAKAVVMSYEIECKGNKPARLIASEIRGVFPPMHAIGSCGEFKEREGLVDQPAPGGENADVRPH